MAHFPIHNKISVQNSLGLGTWLQNSAPASATFPAANRALFQPFVLEEPAFVTDITLYIGAAVSGNVDVGIYSFDGTKLVSSGAQDTTLWTINVIQTIGLTDTLLGRGRYYAAIASDNATLALFRLNISSANNHCSGMLQMASAYVLPAVATLAVLSSGFSPVMTLHTRGATI